MYGYYLFDSWYLILVIASLVLGGLGQLFINNRYKTWSQIPLPGNKTGADVARSMLQSNHVDGVAILEINGKLTDHYDPRDNSLSLSKDNFQNASIASAAVACHEAGHAVQFAKHYLPGIIRTAIVPVVNFASSVWILVFFAGIILGVTGFVYAAIALFAAVVLFQLVTLPVEFDASRRALSYAKSAGYSDEVLKGFRQVLTAAALTYVIAALVSCLQLIYYLGFTRRN